MNRDSFILTAIILALALLLGAWLKDSVSEVLKAQKVETVKFQLVVGY